MSNQQIERYARQIIVPGVGGIAQEHLLSARLMLAGAAADVSSVLAYMVGAGVGEIRLWLPATEAAQKDSLIARASELNPEVTVKPGAEDPAGLNLILALGGDSGLRQLLLAPCLLSPGLPLILVQLDEPASIAIFPRQPPCPLCADAELLARTQPRSGNAGFVAMVAAAEAFKLLAGAAPTPAATLLEFDGFACAARELRQRTGDVQCTCSMGVPARQGR